MAQKFRHELKYLISYNEAFYLKKRLEVFMDRDAHAENGQYKIRSLYFDDYFDHAYEEKLMGISARRKYRIRVYNDSDSVINLECKRKEGSYICKTSANLSRQELDAILLNDYSFLLKRDEELCKRFYIECVSNIMRPKVVVDYEREPFVYDVGDVRITIDSNVRAGVLFTSLFDSDMPTYNVIEDGKTILEIKFTQLLPDIIKELLPPKSSEYTAVSKYVICRDSINYRYTKDYMFK